jgi:hypothetical protein
VPLQGHTSPPNRLLQMDSSHATAIAACLWNFDLNRSVGHLRSRRNRRATISFGGVVIESPCGAVPVNTGAHHVTFRPPQHLFPLTM